MGKCRYCRALPTLHLHCPSCCIADNQYAYGFVLSQCCRHIDELVAKNQQHLVLRYCRSGLCTQQACPSPSLSSSPPNRNAPKKPTAHAQWWAGPAQSCPHPTHISLLKHMHTFTSKAPFNTDMRPPSPCSSPKKTPKTTHRTCCADTLIAQWRAGPKHSCHPTGYTHQPTDAGGSTDCWQQGQLPLGPVATPPR